MEQKNVNVLIVGETETDALNKFKAYWDFRTGFKILKVINLSG